MKQIVEVIIPEVDIKRRISEIAKEIVEHYKSIKDKLILVGLLKGSFIFIADLCREINIPHEVDFMMVSSYGNNLIANRDIKIIKDLNEDISGKHVLIVEDIIDSGNTLKKIWEILVLRGPKSVSICTLLDKSSRREVEIHVQWIGYPIQNEFVVGYGLDYAQQYRYLPYIGHVILIDD